MDFTGWAKRNQGVSEFPAASTGPVPVADIGEDVGTGAAAVPASTKDVFEAHADALAMLADQIEADMESAGVEDAARSQVEEVLVSLREAIEKLRAAVPEGEEGSQPEEEVTDDTSSGEYEAPVAE
jgi:predicted RNA-binding Zn ribbon-like protein